MTRDFFDKVNDKDVIVYFDTVRAEPDVGIMSSYAEITGVVDDNGNEMVVSDTELGRLNEVANKIVDDDDTSEFDWYNPANYR